MKKTRNILMIVYWLQLLAAAILYVCGDYLEFDMAVLASKEEPPVNYYVQMVMILLTLGLVPLALRLFKFNSIHASLTARPAQALLKWGGVRLLILGLLLFVNTLLYYIYGFEPTYGYLAVMVMLTMPFVLPTMERCKTETEEPVETKEETEVEEK